MCSVMRKHEYQEGSEKGSNNHFPPTMHIHIHARVPGLTGFVKVGLLNMEIDHHHVI